MGQGQTTHYTYCIRCSYVLDGDGGLILLNINTISKWVEIFALNAMCSAADSEQKFYLDTALGALKGDLFGTIMYYVQRAKSSH